MKKHLHSYEQYCWVKQKNVVLEETVFHNGTKKVRCTSLSACGQSGGCKNSVLNGMWDKNIVFCPDQSEILPFDN